MSGQEAPHPSVEVGAQEGSTTVSRGPAARRVRFKDAVEEAPVAVSATDLGACAPSAPVVAETGAHDTAAADGLIRHGSQQAPGGKIAFLEGLICL